jgi:hypothetical protein
MWGWLLCWDHAEEQEQVAASNIGGGLEGILVNHPNRDKKLHETSPSTGFPLTSLCLLKEFYFYSCLCKKFSLHLYLL